MKEVNTSEFAALVERLNAGTLALVGFDPAPAPDAIRAALRLTGQWGHEWREDPDEQYEWEGVLVLDVDGQRECLVLRVDPDDGYRSHLAPAILIDADLAQECTLQFTHAPIPVRAEYVTKERGEDDVLYGDDAQMLSLRDDDGHEWMLFGTDNTDDYYPSGQVHWFPKPERTAP